MILVPAANDCTVDSLKCVMAGIHQINKTMGELSYQLEMSDSLDSGNVTMTEEEALTNTTATEQDELSDRADQPRIAKEFDNVLVNLCSVCASSLPVVSIIPYFTPKRSSLFEQILIFRCATKTAAERQEKY